MPDIIKLLPDHVANQIAAGEVIQRPASVVKELLENAIDAGSTEIKLIIKDGGRTSIQVVDNGKGMSETDARMSWERHATSKIAVADDLYKLKTMGFRGEALASIASVSHVEMKSRRTEDDIATWIVIEGSDIKKQEPVNAMPGTSILVKNLFYNVPARRNFLKSNPVETKYIIDEFMRVALARPDIGLYMYNNDVEVFSLKTSTLRQRILDLFNDKKDSQLLEVNENTSVVNVQGFVGSPEIAKKNRGEQFFFVNGRYFRDPYLNHAVVAAYEELIPKDCYPLYILHLEVMPQSIDVNVHPQKTEIKFEEEKIIYQMVRSVVKKALGKYIKTPEMDFNPDIIKSGMNPPDFPSQPRIDTNHGYNPFSEPSQKNAQNRDWKKLFDPYAGESFSDRFDKEQNPQLFPTEPKPAARPLVYTKEYENSCFQLHQSYILSQVRSGLLIIDQQAAHERVLYERYLRSFESQRLPSQEKLFPKLVELPPPDFELLSELTEDLVRLGFDISVFGKNTLIINGIPADVKTSDEQDLLEGMLDYYKAGMNELRLEKRENLAISMARKACIKQGDTLQASEMMLLVEQLFACENPNYSPGGKPIFGRVDMASLQQLLGKR